MARYGTLNLTVTSPAQSWTEPITLAEAKKYLNLPARSPTDTEEDSLIEGFIASAREQAEIEQGRDLVEKQYDLSLDSFPSEIELRPHLVSVDLVQYTDSNGTVTALVADTDYIADTAKQPGVLMPAYGKMFPWFTAHPSSAVLVRFTAGLSATHPFWLGHGKLVRTGMFLLISGWFNNRFPYEVGASVEYPFGITSCLRAGAIQRTPR